jgi:hypothetical protein
MRPSRTGYMSCEASPMKSRLNPVIGRRDILRGFAIGTVVAAASATQPLPAAADTETDAEKRKARYQADSPEVQTFYRVNRYPAA